MTAPKTPDGRYIIVRGRLWRAANLNLPEAERQSLITELMMARRQARFADPAPKAAARVAVDKPKHGLGERGPVWWTDGAPDFNRKLAMNTPYTEWAARLSVDSDL